MRSRILAVAALVLLATVFAVAVQRLFAIRFEAGDIYSAGSTLRSDPLGMRVLHDALALQPGITVERNIGPLAQLHDRAASTTLFLIGFEPRELRGWDDDLPSALGEFARKGGRVAIACEGGDFDRYGSGHFDASPTTRSLSSRPAARRGGSSTTTGTLSGPPITSRRGSWLTSATLALRSSRTLGHLWRFGVDEMGSGKDKLVATRTADLPGLPERISWHTDLFFENLDKEWQTVYTCREQPVVIERAWGRGSVVLSLDDYALSNEAMRHERTPALAAWYVGRSSRVIFDETHLGLDENKGAVALARDYGLGWFLGGLLLLAALFIWKSAFPLVPPPDAESEPVSAVAGRDSAEALGNLLRRHLPKKELLATCVHEWGRTCTREYRQQWTDADRRFGRMGQIVEGQAEKLEIERDPVAAYREICEVLKRR